MFRNTIFITTRKLKKLEEWGEKVVPVIFIIIRSNLSIFSIQNW